MIIIKKYPNRRLYDTSKSQYVNLETIKELVKQCQDFKVVDSRSSEDLTQSILLQIMVEQESVGQGILSPQVLRQLIWCYGNEAQSAMRLQLGNSVAELVKQYSDAPANTSSLPSSESQDPH